MFFASNVPDRSRSIDRLDRSFRSYPSAVRSCARSVWYKSNPGNMCYVNRAGFFGCHSAAWARSYMSYSSGIYLSICRERSRSWSICRSSVRCMLVLSKNMFLSNSSIHTTVAYYLIGVCAFFYVLRNPHYLRSSLRYLAPSTDFYTHNVRTKKCVRRLA